MDDELSLKERERVNRESIVELLETLNSILQGKYVADNQELKVTTALLLHYQLERIEMTLEDIERSVSYISLNVG